MEKDNQTVFIIDTYSPFENDDVVEIFNVNSNWYAIKQVELYFGRPILSNIEKNEDESINFHLYENIEEAREYVKTLKRLEGMKF